MLNTSKGGRLRRLLSAVIVALALHGSAFVAGAQEPVEDEIAVVSAALAQFRELASYRFSGETSLRQETFINENTALVQTEQVLNGIRTSQGTQTEFLVEQTFGGDVEPFSWTLRVERIALEDAVWLRFSDLDVPQSLRGSIFELPQGWFVPQGLPQDITQLTPADLGLATFIDGYARAVVIPPLLDYPLEARTIVSFEQLADETIGGETLRVYQVTFNAFGLYIVSSGQNWGSTLFGFEASGIDVARFFVEGGLQVSGRYWLDSAGQIAQVEERIRIQVTPDQLSAGYEFINETRVRMRFSDFDVPVEIAAPDA
jgi:hypothetical protein